MGQINFGLMNTNAPAEIGNSLANAFAQRRQVEMQNMQLEGAKSQNALAAMQMKKAQGDMEEESAYKNALRGVQNGDYGAAMPQLMGASPSRALALQKQLSEQKKSQVDIDKDQLDMAIKRAAAMRDAMPALYADPTDENAQAIFSRLVGSGLMTQEEAVRGVQMFVQTPMAGRRDFLKFHMQKADQLLESQKPTEFQRTLEASGMSPEQQRAALQAKIRKDTTHAPASVTNVNMALEREEQKAKGKSNVEMYGEVRSMASVARKLNAQLESQARVLEKGFDTGFGTEAKAAAAGVLGALGFEDAEKYATSAQTFGAAAKEVVLQKQLAQKGPQTESDAKRIEQTGSQLGNTKAANMFVIDVARAQGDRDIAQQKFFDGYWRKNGTYEGAEESWYSGDGGKSIFESPRLKKYTSSQHQGSQQGGAAPMGRPPLESFGR